MTEHDALFAAICANPDDDTPRLVFADWLEENGETKRAAYLRASVEGYRQVTADTSASAVYEFFEGDHAPARVLPRPLACDVVDWSIVDGDMHRLYAGVRKASNHRSISIIKSETLPKTKGVKFERSSRGFFDGVRVTQPVEFLKHGKEIFRAAPITFVWFNKLSGEEAREFVSTGFLAQIRELGFSSNVSPEAIRAIGNHRDAARIGKLSMMAGFEGTAQCEGIMSGLHWHGVKWLELGGLDMGYNADHDRLLADILHRPTFQKIQRLMAWGNGLGNATARAVASAGLTELRFLNLGLHGIENSGASAIARSRSLPNLRYLDLSSNSIAGEVASALIAAPKLPKLSVLRLDANGFELKPLPRACRGPTLRVLQIDTCKPTDVSLRDLALSPALHGLWYLSLSSCEMTDRELRALTTGTGFKQLKLLNLSHNRLTANGMKMLTEWPVDLQLLDLSGNNIGDKGAKALVGSPHLKNLKRLAVNGGGTARLLAHFGKKVVP